MATSATLADLLARQNPDSPFLQSGLRNETFITNKLKWKPSGWSEGLYSGACQKRRRKRDVWKGKHEPCTMPHGHGEMRWADYWIYIGSWMNGDICGPGRLYWPVSDQGRGYGKIRYEGHFEHGNFSGVGCEYDVNGRLLGFWRWKEGVRQDKVTSSAEKTRCKDAVNDAVSCANLAHADPPTYIVLEGRKSAHRLIESPCPTKELSRSTKASKLDNMVKELERLGIALSDKIFEDCRVEAAQLRARLSLEQEVKSGVTEAIQKAIEIAISLGIDESDEEILKAYDVLAVLMSDKA